VEGYQDPVSSATAPDCEAPEDERPARNVHVAAKIMFCLACLLLLFRCLTDASWIGLLVGLGLNFVFFGLPAIAFYQCGSRGKALIIISALFLLDESLWFCERVYYHLVLRPKLQRLLGDLERRANPRPALPAVPQGDQELLPRTHVREEWKRFTVTKGRFRASFPGSPKESKETVKTPLGPLTLTHTMLETEAWALSVSYCDYPIIPDNSDKVLLGARDGLQEGLGGTLLHDKEIELGEHPGRSFQLETARGMVYRTRMYLVGSRFYQLIAVTTTREEGWSRKADRFFDSFELLTP
jgi:hypothetical protein